MLIQPDKNELGDKRLSPEEGLAQLKEKVQKDVDAKKIPDQKILEDKNLAVGAPMSHTELIRRITKLNAAIVVRDGGWPGAVAVYFPGYDEDEGKEVLKYATGFMKGVLSEYDHITVDAKGLPKRHVRGWRPAVNMLVCIGALTQDQVDKAFGKPVGVRALLFEKYNQDRRQ